MAPWGWALAGAATVLVVAWFSTTIITALKQHSDEERITRIERIVIGIEEHHRARKGVVPRQPQATAHQERGPHYGGGSDQGGGSAKGGGEAPSVPGKSGTDSGSVPQAGGTNGGQSRPNLAPAPVEVPSLPAPPAPVAPAVEQVTGTVGSAVQGVERTACTITESLGVCP